MNTNCFDIGKIQAFLDGELETRESSDVSSHIANCDACAVMLAEAEDESAVVFPALEREFNTLVPTHRLWNKINDSITIERENMPFWRKTWAFLTVALVNPSIAVAATVLLIAGAVATGILFRTPVSEIANETVAPAKSVSKTIAATQDDTPSALMTGQPTRPYVTRFEQASYRPYNRRITAVRADYPTSTAANSPGYMPGEESYVKTISSLSKTIEGQKDGIMRPSERIAYERDMAVVNDAIAKMRKQVKKSPKNESAKQVLYSSYQNKIDLLNSVSQKEELMASLK